MTERGRRPPSSKQAEVLEYVAYFGRVQTAFPNLRQTADAIGVKTLQTAKVHIDALTRKNFLKNESPDQGTRKMRVVDEPQIPVIRASERIDPEAPLLTESQIIETIRGVLGETFKPEPEFFVLLESKTGLTKMLAISQCSDPGNGTTVVARIRDKVVVGKIQGQHFELESFNPGSEMTTRRIAKSDPDFRIDGVVVGTIIAQSVQIKD